MITRALVSIVLILPVVAGAGPHLDSAFGITFGEPFSPSAAQSTRNLQDGGRLYRLNNPPHPYDVLQGYTVRTDADNTVREISGTAELTSAERCSKEQSIIAQAIADKYAPVARLSTGGDLLRRTELRIGADRVEVVCIGDALEVRYLSAAPQAAEPPAESQEPSRSGADDKASTAARDTSAL